jgi:hypothetical protein
MDLYRADSRDYAKMCKEFPRGFEAWRPLSLAQAKTLVRLFIGERDRDGLPKLVVDAWASSARPTLTDLSTLIKYTKDRTTFWVSTAINTDCGGQSSGAPIHHIRVALKEFVPQGSSFVPLTMGRTSDLKPSILFDADDLDSATLIAINHGPRKDAEVSFLTSIPIDAIVAPTTSTTSKATAEPVVTAPTSDAEPAMTPLEAPEPRFEAVATLVLPSASAPRLELRKELITVQAKSDAAIWTCPTCHGTFDTQLKKTRHGFEKCVAPSK